ncbi:MAG: deoxyribonuclease V [Syntrophales bacterium]|nr:deoxyribonuclease V [Syntrophales bacterium]
MISIRHLHEWELDIKKAREIQKQLRSQLILTDENFPQRPCLVAGADVSYSRESEKLYAAVVVLSYEDMKISEEAYASGSVTFPYIPGLLSFREGPILLQAFAKLKEVPDVVLLDGQGIAHPRGLGLASHIGLFLDLPTIGCAKSRLLGECGEVGSNVGDQTPLYYEGQVVGTALRTKKNVKPIYVSPGHRISLTKACQIVLDTCRGYRIPEPLRQAHILVNRLRTEL